MQKVIVYILTIGAGWLIAFGIGKLVGLIFPAAAIPVFVVLAAIWAWIGWQYANMRDSVRDRLS